MEQNKQEEQAHWTCVQVVCTCVPMACTYVRQQNQNAIKKIIEEAGETLPGVSTIRKNFESSEKEEDEL